MLDFITKFTKGSVRHQAASFWYEILGMYRLVPKKDGTRLSNEESQSIRKRLHAREKLVDELVEASSYFESLDDAVAALSVDHQSEMEKDETVGKLTAKMTTYGELKEDVRKRIAYRFEKRFRQWGSFRSFLKVRYCHVFNCCVS